MPEPTKTEQKFNCPDCGKQCSEGDTTCPSCNLDIVDFARFHRNRRVSDKLIAQQQKSKKPAPTKSVWDSIVGGE